MGGGKRYPPRALLFPFLKHPSTQRGICWWVRSTHIADPSDASVLLQCISETYFWDYSHCTNETKNFLLLIIPSMHPVSSEQSAQSALPSQTFRIGTQTSVAQRNSCVLHHPPFNVRQNVSSLPSPQSLYASQTTDCGTHLLFQQRKSCVPLHPSQPASSLPSWQSLALLQSHGSGMQWPFWHSNDSAWGLLHGCTPWFTLQYVWRKSWILPLQQPQ